MKITIDNFVDDELYAIAARLYYYHYLVDPEGYSEDPHWAVCIMMDMFKEHSIDIRQPSQVDQFLANGCDVDEMMETFIVIDPIQSYQQEINYLIHREQQRWEKWHR